MESRLEGLRLEVGRLLVFLIFWIVLGIGKVLLFLCENGEIEGLEK